MANYALSGQMAQTPMQPQVQRQAPQAAPEAAERAQLQAFLQIVDESSPEELATYSDRFTDAQSHIRTPVQAQTQTQTQWQSAKKGSLSAEAILSFQVASPTGTQVINTLQLGQLNLAQFDTLRNTRLGPLHQRLACFVPQLQAAWGDKNFYRSPADSFNGLCGILDPTALSGYIPQIDALVDLGDEQIKDCFVPLHNVDGYPTIDGLPVWERNAWERVDYFNLFKLFRDMRYAFYNEADALVTNRSLAVLAKAVHIDTPMLHYLAQVYHWGLRAQLYDGWMEGQQRARQVVRRELMLDRHEKISQALIAKAFACLNKNAEKMSPKDALAMLELGLRYERLSQGMQGDKPEGVSQTKGQPLISVVNQTNNTTGPLQVNNETGSQRALAEDMRRPDTLVGILSVLQRSGALSATLTRAAKEAAGEEVDGLAEILDEPDAE